MHLDQAWFLGIGGWSFKWFGWRRLWTHCPPSLVRETRTDQPENIGKVDDRSFSANGRDAFRNEWKDLREVFWKL